MQEWILLVSYNFGQLVPSIWSNSAFRALTFIPFDLQKHSSSKRKLWQCQLSAVLLENSCLVMLFIEQTLTLLMKICVNHGKIRFIMEGGYLETLGSSHVVIDNPTIKNNMTQLLDLILSLWLFRQRHK